MQSPYSSYIISVSEFSFCFVIFVAAVAQFRDTAYSVVEGRRNFSVVIEKDGRNAQMVTLSVQFLAGSAMSKESLSDLSLSIFLCKCFFNSITVGDYIREVCGAS